MTARVQQPAPDFRGQAVVKGEFKQISLSDYQGKFLVLFFYPLDFTFVCPTEILAFGDKAEEFRKIGAELVACSVDSHFTHLKWTQTPRKEGGIEGIQIPLLSDLDKKISAAYGILLDAGIALRATFVIDPKGVLRHITVNDLPVGRSVEETLRVVQAVQFADKHGEVCPAGWTPGADTMKADPEKSKEYFAKQK